MAKKLKTQAKDEETQLANAVRSSAQQIWQAGLGAFAKAQEEGGRVFSKLVKEGTELQKRAEDRVADAGGTAKQMDDGAGKQASGPWDKLEQVFEDRVSRALSKIGVPTQKDIQALSKRIEQLSLAIAELSGKTAAPAAGTPLAKTAARRAAKPAPKAAARTVARPAPEAAVKTAAIKPLAKAKPASKAAPKAGVNFPTAASVAKSAPKAVAKKVAVKKAAGKGAATAGAATDTPST
ncbi:phasin family protein [Janthinobacterium sp.]|uniref:phasin family protein n=1 Tax=Janthinobacterium sp. TaxID=1871054 RepID=UPI00293D2F2A|nr:phasin family protein [Janthinobacterium sp.]